MKKWVERSDMSWRFPPRYDHNDTLPAKPEPTGVGDLIHKHKRQLT